MTQPPQDTARHLTQEEAAATLLTTRCLLLGEVDGFSIWLGMDDRWERISGPDEAWIRQQLQDLWGVTRGQLQLVE